MHIADVDHIADQLVFINLDITCWSGKKTVTPEDLGLNRQQLPPETLVSLGEKQLIDPAALREFTTIRSAARRHCLAVGTRFMGGYAVPAAKAGELLARLDGLGQDYQDARTAFLVHFESQIAAWAARQPLEWQALIRETLLSAEDIGGKLSFAAQAVRFRAPEPTVVAHAGLGEALTGLSGQVLREMAVLARDALEKSFQGKTEVTRRALNPFQAIRDKLEGLSFIDGRFLVIVAEIDQRLAGIPPRQPITGPVLEGLRQFLCLASQPDALRTWADHAGIAVPSLAGLNVPMDFNPGGATDHPATREGVASDRDAADRPPEPTSEMDAADEVFAPNAMESADRAVTTGAASTMERPGLASSVEAGPMVPAKATASVADEDDEQPVLADADDAGWFF